MKRCTACHTERAPDAFYRDRRAKDGRWTRCAVCCREGRPATAEVVRTGDSDQVWRDVSGYEGLYEVSDLGVVQLIERSHRRRPGVIAATPNADGYLSVRLTDREGRRRRVAVHRLVALAFLGLPLEGQQVRHLDGDRMNPKLTNLAWGTVTENAADRELVRQARERTEQAGDAPSVG